MNKFRAATNDEIERLKNQLKWQVSLGGVCLLIILLLFLHAPLGVRSAVHIRQPPQRAVLSQVDCFIQCDVVTFQISLDGVQPRDTGYTLVTYSSSLEGVPLGSS